MFQGIFIFVPHQVKLYRHHQSVTSGFFQVRLCWYLQSVIPASPSAWCSEVQDWAWVLWRLPTGHEQDHCGELGYTTSTKYKRGQFRSGKSLLKKTWNRSVFMIMINKQSEELLCSEVPCSYPQSERYSRFRSDWYSPVMRGIRFHSDMHLFVFSVILLKHSQLYCIFIIGTTLWMYNGFFFVTKIKSRNVSELNVRNSNNTLAFIIHRFCIFSFLFFF